MYMCLQLFELFSVSSEGNSSTSSGQFLNCLETVRFEFNLFGVTFKVFNVIRFLFQSPLEANCIAWLLTSMAVVR